MERRIQQAAAAATAQAVAQAEAGHMAEIRELRDELKRARYDLAVAAADYDVAARRNGVRQVAAYGYDFPKAAGESK